MSHICLTMTAQLLARKLKICLSSENLLFPESLHIRGDHMNFRCFFRLRLRVVDREDSTTCLGEGVLHWTSHADALFQQLLLKAHCHCVATVVDSYGLLCNRLFNRQITYVHLSRFFIFTALKFDFAVSYGLLRQDILRLIKLALVNVNFADTPDLVLFANRWPKTAPW